ncbi:MAG: amidohydrolase family protein [Burkholderiales bacterium]|nr:amidohydrolase family protein [Burkholderiales bacterium]MBI3792065.1 amidohydrolase family protein [Gemmatimonadota bacterium]
MRRSLHALAALVLVAPLAGAQTVAITGGTVYPVKGPKIENGTVVIVDGKITAVGAGVAVPAGATVIDARGKWVTPGLINSSTSLGLVEVGAVQETRDNGARGTNGVAAFFQPWEGLNANSVMLPQARNDGLTTVITHPRGGWVSGQAALIDLSGSTFEQLVRKAPAAMFASFGHVTARGELYQKLRELLSDAKAYATRRAQYELGNSRTLAATKADLEALQPVLAGTVPIVIEADKRTDIEAVIRIAREFKLKAMVARGAEAWMVASELAQAKIPVLTGGILNIPKDFASLGQRTDNAALLRKAGVSVLLIADSYADGETFNPGNVRYEAGNAVSAGLSWDDGLRALTLAPAEAFGVADKVGALAPGMDGNVVVWSGDPFEFATRAEAVLIKGRRVEGPSRRDELQQRYRTLPPAGYAKP